ncbi:MAG: hypothetical protein KF878_14710 [Planctomycetes bacterium]|nr:hypothetical protein [Planctomycetota bacterium]
MYVLLIAGGFALSIVLGLLVLPEKPAYILGPFLGLLAFVPTVMLLSRWIGEKVRPFFEAAQRHAQTGNLAQAVQSLEGALAWRRWQLFLEQQVNTEAGLLLYAQGDEKKAIERLRRGYPKVSTGHLVLGAMLYRGGSLEEAQKALELGIRYNKKSPILYNVLAWLLAKEGRRDAAMDALSRALKADPADEPTADNLKRLQNDKRMNMKPFGDLWFMLKFETPKGMGVAAVPFRKGWRQPPKARRR